MYWKLVGPSEHERRPPTQTMLAYDMCVPDEAMQRMDEFQITPYGHLKSFTMTRRVISREALPWPFLAVQPSTFSCPLIHPCSLQALGGVCACMQAL
jgi:hypothetical protein